MQRKKKKKKKIRYDDLGKPMKQTNFTVKKTWGETYPKSNPL